MTGVQTCALPILGTGAVEEMETDESSEDEFADNQEEELVVAA